MVEVRCENCATKIAEALNMVKGKGDVSEIRIKCKKCGTMNILMPKPLPYQERLKLNKKS
jgi:hypothetical protein